MSNSIRRSHSMTCFWSCFSWVHWTWQFHSDHSVQFLPHLSLVLAASQGVYDFDDMTHRRSQQRAIVALSPPQWFQKSLGQGSKLCHLAQAKAIFSSVAFICFCLSLMWRSFSSRSERLTTLGTLCSHTIGRVVQRCLFVRSWIYTPEGCSGKEYQIGQIHPPLPDHPLRVCSTVWVWTHYK